MRRGAKTAKKKSRDVPLEELNGILARTRSVLSKEDQQTLEEAVDTLAVLTVELEKKGTSIRRLRQMLFGARTEKTSTIFKDEDLLGEQTTGNDDPAGGGDCGPSDQSTGTATTNGSRPKRKVKGHGRNGAADYHGAERVPVSHPTLKRGDPCPACPKGKLYPVKEPATLVRITGMAPLQAKVFELARLRCNACNFILTAPAPEGIGTAKYDETATAMVGLFKYGTGLPWNRLEHVQRWLGMPMPSTTQWELVRDAEPALAPVFAELVRQAAQGEVVHNDDTAMKVLELMDGAKPFTEEAKDRAASDSDRTGVYTTGIVSRVGERRLALFFTGPRHAGENLETVLKQRAEALAPPIQMSDALSHNTAGDFGTQCIVGPPRVCPGSRYPGPREPPGTTEPPSPSCARRQGAQNVVRARLGCVGSWHSPSKISRVVGATFSPEGQTGDAGAPLQLGVRADCRDCASSGLAGHGPGRCWGRWSQRC